MRSGVRCLEARRRYCTFGADKCSRGGRAPRLPAPDDAPPSERGNCKDMREPFWIKAGVAVSATIVFGLAVTYARLLATGAVNVHLADFVAYYSAGKLVLAGHGASLYDFAVMRHTQARLTAPLRMPGGVSPFLYPPWFALVVAPLSAVPYTAAYILWFALNVVLAIAVLRALSRHGGLRGMISILFTLLGLSFLPVFAAFGQGQVSVLLLALATAVLVALGAERDLLAGVLLAVFLIKPQYALPVAGVLLIQGRRRAFGTFSLCALFLTAIPVPFLGAGIENAYIHSLVHLSALHGTAGYMAPPSINFSVLGVSVLLDPHLGEPLWVAVSAAVCMLVAWSAYRVLDLESAVAAAILCGLLVSPHVLIYDVSLLILPLAVLARPRAWWACLSCAAYLAPLAGLLLHRGVPLTVGVMGAVMLAILYREWRRVHEGARTVACA